MELPFTCWRCEKFGHPAAECQPEPARTRQELDERISRLVERWQQYEISTGQKKAWIADEMQIFDKSRGSKAEMSAKGMSSGE